jgi:uncharacterized membrane protein (DUF106 family)
MVLAWGSDLSRIQKILLIIGTGVIIVGLFWPWLTKIPLGRLPGDIVISKPHLKVYLPITTMILISIVVSLILWVLRRKRQDLDPSKKENQKWSTELK